jgi:hypothetical protein
MRLAFTAVAGGFDDDECFLVCGVTGPDGDGISQYLSLERDAEKNLEDWGVHIEFNDQGTGGYDCVARCTLTRQMLSIDLKRPLGQLAGVDGFDVTLGIDLDSINRIRDGLLRVFRGMPNILTVEL